MLIFALVPWAARMQRPVAALLRDDPRGATLTRYRLGAAAAAIALAALVMATSFDVKLGAAYVAAAVAAFAAAARRRMGRHAAGPQRFPVRAMRGCGSRSPTSGGRKA